MSWDAEGGTVLSGTYDFDSGFDLGSVRRIRLTTEIGALVVNVLDTIDSRTLPIDQWESVDGTEGASADAQIWVRYTDDDPAGSPAWSDWQRLDAAEFKARGFQFQARLSTADPAFNIFVDTLEVHADEVV